jgi:hypothetical protein
MRLAAADKFEHGRLLFAVGADILERVGIGPQTAAFLTFIEFDATYLEKVESYAAAGTITKIVAVFGRYLHCVCPAMIAKFGTDEHQAKTSRAGHRFEPGFAKRALRAVARDARAAVWTI